MHLSPEHMPASDPIW